MWCGGGSMVWCGGLVWRCGGLLVVWCGGVVWWWSGGMCAYESHAGNREASGDLVHTV